MRGTFARTLAELAERDSRVMLLTADLGYMALEPFSDRFPDRFLNVGVAEQNMIGIASGLAEAGFIPFVYSIVTFAALRPYEFIRNGPILQKLPVRIIGVGGGVDYAYDGATHYGLEDIGVMRIQPGITVVAPADYEQARTALMATWDMPGPVYYRLSKDDKTIVPNLNGRFGLGECQVIREGVDAIFLCMGTIATEAVSAADALQERGVSAAVAVVASINPPPKAALRNLLKQHDLALTVEAHYTVGGIGSLVSEVVAEDALPCRVLRCGISEMPDGATGSPGYVYDTNGISAARLAERAFAAIL